MKEERVEDYLQPSRAVHWPPTHLNSRALPLPDFWSVGQSLSPEQALPQNLLPPRSRHWLPVLPGSLQADASPSRQGLQAAGLSSQTPPFSRLQNSSELHCLLSQGLLQYWIRGKHTLMPGPTMALPPTDSSQSKPVGQSEFSVHPRRHFRPSLRPCEVLMQ